MQYKGSFLLMLLVSAFELCTAQSQNRYDVTKDAANHKTTTTVIRISRDSIPAGKKIIVLGKSGKQDAEEVMPPAALPPQKIKRPMQSVPLAGEYGYFGSMNDYVIDFVKQYMESHNRTLNVVQGRGRNQFSVVENVLLKNNLPKELKYLAVIESALNNRAISKAGAVGPWQLMESTAKLMGLTVNKKRDERTDWYKSTHAAAKYLNKLYKDLDDWLLVIAAYNSGPTPVLRAISKTGSRNFWDIKKYLPRETQGHVLAFIATATIFESLGNFLSLGKIPEDFKFCNDGIEEKKTKSKVPKIVFTPEELKNMAIIHLKEPLCLDILAEDLSIEKSILNRWNPDYELFVMDIYPEEVYKFRIPKDKIDAFLEKKESLSKKSEKYFREMVM